MAAVALAERIPRHAAALKRGGRSPLCVEPMRAPVTWQPAASTD